MKIIYCDGSSLGNPGPGGFAVVAVDTERKNFWEFGGGEVKATNNQMELAACICALKIIIKSFDKSRETKFIMKLDSKYVIQGVTEWTKNWVKNNWKNSQKKDVLNKEYWVEILKLMSEIEAKKIILKWEHVYGHTGEEWNEKCDQIAKDFAGSFKGGEKPVLKQAYPY